MHCFFHETDCSSGNNYIVYVISCYNQNLDTAFPASAATAQKLEQISIILQKKHFSKILLKHVEYCTRGLFNQLH